MKKILTNITTNERKKRSSYHGCKEEILKKKFYGEFTQIMTAVMNDLIMENAG